MKLQRIGVREKVVIEDAGSDIGCKRQDMIRDRKNFRTGLHYFKTAYLFLHCLSVPLNSYNVTVWGTRGTHIRSLNTTVGLHGVGLQKGLVNVFKYFLYKEYSTNIRNKEKCINTRTNWYGIMTQYDVKSAADLQWRLGKVPPGSWAEQQRGLMWSSTPQRLGCKHISEKWYAVFVELRCIF